MEQETANHYTAIVLSAGRGSRMHSDVPKQYLPLLGHPVLFYSLKCFQDCSWINDIVLVVGEDYLDYVKEKIVGQYRFTKVISIVAGGAERYDSVYNGLLAAKHATYVLIHDGARPLITPAILERGKETVETYGSAIAGVPAKDTVKIARKDGRVEETPDRSSVWQIQTPQMFSRELLLDACQSLRKSGPDAMHGITDDAMILERTGTKPYLFFADYTNIKITTPDDMEMAARYLSIKE